MSKGKTTTTTSTDPTQMAMYQDLYGKAKGIASQPFVPYTGARVAGFNPDQLQGFDATRNIFDQSMSYDPRSQLNTLATQNAPSLLNTDIGAYQNPFQTQVIDNTLGDLNRARQMQIQSDQDAAIGRGAFGGSRSALLESETNRNFADRAGNIAADLRSRGFDRATNLAGMDIDNEFRNRGFQAGLLGNQLSDQYRNLGLLSGIGGQQQGLQQRGMDAGYNEFLRALNYGPQQLGLLAQGVSALPTQTSTSQSKRGSSIADIGSAAAGIGQLFSSGIFGSDKRMKKDIKFLSKEKGYNIYSWNWNDKAKSIGWNKYPTTGVIAQEVAHIPNAVTVGDHGYLMVNYGEL
tara:strand:+ start:955 stop:1998 length:1044 start_codon:yes stop_codon:yes gene_type:complete